MNRCRQIVRSLHLTKTYRTKAKPLLHKNDCILLAVLLLFGVATLLLTQFLSGTGSTVTVTVDGKFFGSWTLTEECEIAIPGTSGTNLLQITNGTAFISDAECPDLICLHHRPISHTGERIVCLPNRIIVSIEDSHAPDSPDAVSQ